MSERIRILLVDDHEVVRLGLRTALELEADLRGKCAEPVQDRLRVHPPRAVVVRVAAQQQRSPTAVARDRERPRRRQIVALHVGRPGRYGAEVRQREALDEVRRHPPQVDRQRPPACAPRCDLPEVGRRRRDELG